METTNQLPVKEAPVKRFTALFAEHYEQGAFYILLLWCLLPVLMAVNYLISGMLGRYPTTEELIRDGLTPGNVNYHAALQAYQTLFFILGAITFCFVLLCVLLCRRRVFSLRSVRRMPWFYLLILFLLWATISSLRADSLDISLLGSSYMRDGLVSYYIYGSVFLCAAVIHKEDHRKTLLRVFTAVMCCMALIVVVQENADNAFINYCFSSRKAAVFNQFNHFGYMLCMAITAAFGLFLYDREGKGVLRYLYLAAAVFLSYVLIINNTFGAMLATLVALPVVLIFYLRSGRRLNPRAVALVLLVILAAGLCFFTLSAGKSSLLRNFTQLKTDLVKIFTRAKDAGSAGTDRFALWQETIGKIAERPIMGFGAEGLSRDNALISGAQIGLLPHNTYLQIAAHLGIVGLLLYLAALVCLCVHHWKYIRRLDPMVLAASGAAFAYLVSAFVGCPVFNTEPYFWLFLGLVTATREGEASLFSLAPVEEPVDKGAAEGAGRSMGVGAKHALRRPLDSQSRLGRAMAYLVQNHERLAFCLLLIWCLIPVFMSIDYFVSGALGRYPTLETILRAGLTPGYVNYVEAVRTYQTLLLVLGLITVLFSTLCLVLCRERIFSLQSVRRTPWFYLLALLLVWAIVSALAADFFHLAFVGSAYVRDGLLSYLIYGSVFLCASLIRQEGYRKKLIQTFAAVMSYLALIMLIQEKADIDFLNYCFSSRRAAVFNQFNHFGYMLCMAAACCAGLFLYDRKVKKGLRCLYLAGVFYLLYALIVNNTFGAILAAAAALLIILVLYLCSGRKLNLRIVALVLLAALLAAVCFLALSPDKNSLLGNFTQLRADLVKIFTRAEDAGSAGTERITLWRDTLQRIRERPIFGFGPEGFTGKNAITDDKRPHNEYLQIAGYLGIPALIIYLAALVTLAWHHGRRIKTLSPMLLAVSGVAVAYLISAFFGNPVFNTAPYFWLFLGLTSGAGEDEKPLLWIEKDSAVERRSILYALILLLVLGAFAVGAGLSLRNEKRAELEDLQTMHAANTAARRFIDPATLAEDDVAYYWFDKRRELLLPSFISAPVPYGQGSANSGGGSADFYKEYGLIYNYDEKTDYSGKVIVVAATSDAENGLKLAMTWVDPTP